MMARVGDLTVKVTLDATRFMQTMRDLHASMRMAMFFQPYMTCQRRGWGEAAYWAGIDARNEAAA